MIKKIKQYLKIRSKLRREILERKKELRRKMLELKKVHAIFDECSILRLAMQNRESLLKEMSYGQSRWECEQLECFNKEIETLISKIK